MTEKKRLQEQMASHTYRRKEVKPVRSAEPLREEVRTLQRVVTIPDANLQDSWNEFDLRRKELGRARLKPRKYVGPVARTFARTGSYAPSGRTFLRPLPDQSTRIPQRSGRLAFRQSLILRLLGVLAAGILLVLSANFAFASNAFRIEQVNVVGTHNDVLIRSIQKMGMQGQNIFLLNVPAMAQRIQLSPLVDSATLSKELPNHLLVTLVERTPVLLWRTAKGTYSIDKKGVVVARVDDGVETSSLPMLKESNGQELTPGMHLDAGEITFATELFKRLPAILDGNAYTLRYNDMRYANATPNASLNDSRGSFIVESAAGWRAYLGGVRDTNPLENRLLELQHLLKFLQQKQLKVATIDLRYGLHPVYTLK